MTTPRDRAAANAARSGEEPGRARVLMWEAKAAPGRADALVAYVVAHADPDADVYRSADDRVVVIDPTGRGLPDVPADFVTRPPHGWPFEPVRR